MASDASQSAPSEIKSPEDRAPKKSKGGRPRKTLDMDKLAAFMANYPTAENTALFFDISLKTIYREIKRETGLSFDQFREKHMMKTRHILVQRALYRAIQKESDRMLELCLKNLNGWNGTNDPIVAQPTVILKYSLEAPPPLPPPRDVTPEEAS